MYFYLEEFGRDLASIRKKLNYSQRKVAELSRVSLSTISRIEKGHTLPDNRVLDDLSVLYNLDLMSILLSYRISAPSKFNIIKKSAEHNLEYNLIKSLKDDIRNLKEIKSLTNNKFILSTINQNIFFYEGIILYRLKDYTGSLIKLNKVLSIPNPNYSIKNFKNYYYNDFQLRVLMNIGLINFHLKNKKLYKDILLFCFDRCKSDGQLFRNIVHNISSLYSRFKDYEKALYYNNLNLESSKRNNDFTNLPLVYYNKGICEFRMGNPDYMNSFNNAIKLYELYGNISMANIVKEKLNKFLDIQI